MKISVVGVGYVGLSLATLLSRNHEVVAIDIVQAKVDLINNRIPPIVDSDIEYFFNNHKLNLQATTSLEQAFDSEFIIIATPTNYNEKNNQFDTSSVTDVLSKLHNICPNSTFVIKSTVPIGFTSEYCLKNNMDNVLFSPEFLREGKALYDNLHPSRIIVGTISAAQYESALKFVNLLKSASLEKETPFLIIRSTEAESVKLFSNTYLAMRVAFFNELDSFAITKNLSTANIIKGICLDQRIGNYYNNPSFGYGGYCLPKDTKQLLSEYNNTPNDLIRSIVTSNNVRKRFMVDYVKSKVNKTQTIGIYKLAMKYGSDNFRQSAIIDIIDQLLDEGYSLVIYEPLLTNNIFNCPLLGDFSQFISSSDIILTNRMTPELKPFNSKIICRDIFNRD